METILSWVKSVVLYGIFASVILMLSPNKSYMKHISLVVGLLFVLVIVHPIMDIFELDGKTYTTYIENFLKLEDSQNELSKDHIALYEESVNIQLITALNEKGYNVNEVSVEADQNGNVSNVCLVFQGEVKGLEQLEMYLRNVFGQEVEIYYEND